MRKWIVNLAVVSALGCAPVVVVPVTPPEAMEQWAQLHPAGAQALGVWVRNHPGAASWLFDWDGAHSEGTHELISWAIYHPGAGVPIFVSTHPGWSAFDRFAMAHQPAVWAFFMWARQFPGDAQRLADHPRGLWWAGHHLYAADAQMLGQ